MNDLFFYVRNRTDVLYIVCFCNLLKTSFFLAEADSNQ